VHAPDLPVWGQDSPKLGLGLWNNPTATLLLELVTLAAGVAVYLGFRSRRHPVRPGRLAGLLLVLVAVYLVSLFGPPPPSVTAIAVADIIGLLLLAGFAAWADRRPTPAELVAAGLPVR
jgi:drug/metabolite transporter (DMT)-like permease